MRILMFSWEFPPQVVGGLARHVKDLSVALARKDIEIDIITRGGEDLPAIEEVEGVTVYRVKSYPISALDFVSWVQQLNMAMLEEGVSLLNEGHKYDLIHVHDWLVAYCGRAMKHIFHLPLLATIHATEHGRNNGLYTDEQRFISDIEWWLTYESWKVICCSSFMQDELQGLFHLPENKLRVIHNGVDQNNFTIEELDFELRGKYANPDEKIIFYVGRLVREKGVQNLIAATPKILEKHPDAKLVIAGTGPHKEELEKITKELNLENKVSFAGFVEDEARNQLYKFASAAVFPSLYEPFGIVALEGMAAGTPVVVADTGGLSDIVEHEIDGLKVYRDHIQSLVDQISRLLSDQELSSKLRKAGYEKITNHYTWDSIALKTAKVYEEIIIEHEKSNWKSPQWQGEMAKINAMSKNITELGKYYN